MAKDEVKPLSERELDLVRLLARGLSNKEIARELYISPNTVKVHLRNIYAKLEVSSRTEASMVALRAGLVELDRPEEEQAEPAAPKAQPVIKESVAPAVPALPAMPSAPLARWQQAYLLLAVLLVGFGLWLVWPRRARMSEPFTDRRAPVSSWIPGQVSRWQELAQMPMPRSRLALVAYQGRIYAIAGETPTGVSSAVDIYWPEQDDWVRGIDKPTAVANVGAAALGDRIYVPGGSLSDGRMSDELEVFDLENETWIAGSKLSHGICAYALSTYRGQLYLFGGWDGVSYVARSYRYDPGTDAWQTLAPMPTARAFAGAGTIGERIYVVGGYDGQQELDTCEVYDPQADAWEACPSMNAPRGGISVAVIADTLYAIGGGWNSYLVENEYFYPAQGTWITFPSPLLQEWRNLGVVANETTLYAIGGWDGEYLGVNQAYRALYQLYLPSAMGQKGSTE